MQPPRLALRCPADPRPAFQGADLRENTHDRDRETGRYLQGLIRFLLGTGIMTASRPARQSRVVGRQALRWALCGPMECDLDSGWAPLPPSMLFDKATQVAHRVADCSTSLRGEVSNWIVWPGERAQISPETPWNPHRTRIVSAGFSHHPGSTGAGPTRSKNCWLLIGWPQNTPVPLSRGGTDRRRAVGGTCVVAGVWQCSSPAAVGGRWGPGAVRSGWGCHCIEAAVWSISRAKSGPCGMPTCLARGAVRRQ